MRVAIIEPRSAGYRLIDRAHELGYQVVVLTANRGQRQIPSAHLALADHVDIMDTNDDAACLQRLRALHRQHPFTAVLPGFEHYVELAAAASAELGLRGLSTTTALALRRKHVMRDVVRAHGIAQPRYVLVTDEADLDEATAQVGLPCVIKPVDQSGSLNVRKVATRAEVVTAFRNIHDYGTGYLDRAGLPLALIEEYVDGDEFSVEGYVEDTAVVILGITEKLLGPEPWFVEVGHMVPARLEPAAARAVERYAVEVIQALGVELGPFHAELRLTARGPMLMEVAARLPGDRIPDLLRLATGADLYEITLKSYLGLPCATGTPVAGTGHAGIRFFLQPEISAYQTMRISPELHVDSRLREIGALIQPGQPVPAQGSSSSRLGYALAATLSHRATAEALDAAVRGVLFVPAQSPSPRRDERSPQWDGTS